jgi:hypothetical protein
MKILLHIIAPLFLIVAGPAQAAPLAFSSPDVSSVVLIQRRPPPLHPVPPLGPLIDLPHPDNFHPTQPGPDFEVGGGIVKTKQELYRDLYGGANLQRRHDCADPLNKLADPLNKLDKCKGRSELLR